ncbi:uncharacterized protein TNCV_1354621 [Trichonephila clavipes]|uniref:Uncharacterized protein n=1 Tax=Trichonephila clavipes TaxID=2585209 RepID=A0A8X6VJ99_TRICX|nr:uncharacterized protein TNCV_1354621 [Trichonephila clavipes]
MERLGATTDLTCIILSTYRALSGIRTRQRRTRLPPTQLHSGLKIVELASYLAAGLFNEVNSSLLMVMNEAGIVVGMQSFNYAEPMDNQCVSQQNRRSSLESKEGRKALLQAQNKVYEEGLL